MVTEIELLESPDLSPLDFYLWGWMKSKVYKRKVDTQDTLFAHILDAAACIKKREDQLRQTTYNLHTGVAKCIEVDSIILEHFLLTVTNLSFKH
jgi:hypothetical protein